MKSLLFTNVIRLKLTLKLINGMRVFFRRTLSCFLFINSLLLIPVSFSAVASPVDYGKEGLSIGVEKRGDVIEALKQFNGGKYKDDAVIKNYTENPKETEYRGDLDDQEKVRSNVMENEAAQTIDKSSKKRKQFKIDMNEPGMKRSQEILDREEQSDELGDMKELKGIRGSGERSKKDAVGEKGKKGGKEGKEGGIISKLDCVQSERKCRDIYSSHICRESLVINQRECKKKLNLYCLLR